jgi:neutral ceramidase
MTGTTNRRQFLSTAASAAAAFACSGPLGGSESRGGPRYRLCAGAAPADITPAAGVLLDGYLMRQGPVKGAHDPLLARALVLDDGATRLAIVLCDACVIERRVFDRAKGLVHAETGLSRDHMLMAATHSHAAVRASGINTGPLDEQYLDLLARQIAAAVIQAEGQLAPASVGWGSFAKPQFVRCRRFLCQAGSVSVNPFGQSGERVKSVAGQSSAVIEPAGPVDPQFSLLSVRHADGRPLAVLGNYSVHYCGGYQGGLVSADYFGAYARALEAKLDAGADRPPFVGLMSNGTSGNTGALLGDGKKRPPFDWIEASGQLLADDTLAILDALEYRADLTLAMQTAELELGVRRPAADRLAWAEQVLAQPQGPHPHRWTPIYAREALHLSRYPETVKLPLQALRIGRLGIAAAPCEVFAETGLAIKQHSPLDATFTIQLANGYGGYLPPPEQHALGGYETWPARSSLLEVEAEPKIRLELLRLLEQVTG